jgi:hypothetical protein
MARQTHLMMPSRRTHALGLAYHMLFGSHNAYELCRKNCHCKKVPLHVADQHCNALVGNLLHWPVTITKHGMPGSPGWYLLSKQHDSSDDGVMICRHSQAAAVLNGISHDNCLHTGILWDDVSCLCIT